MKKKKSKTLVRAKPGKVPYVSPAAQELVKAEARKKKVEKAMDKVIERHKDLLIKLGKS